MLDPGSGNCCATMKQAVRSILEARREVALHELTEHLADFGPFVVRGEARLHLLKYPEIIIWAGLSEVLAHCIRDLVADGDAYLQEVSPLRYGQEYLRMARSLPQPLQATALYVPAVLRAAPRLTASPALAAGSDAGCRATAAGASAAIAGGIGVGVPVVPRCFVRLVADAGPHEPRHTNGTAPN
jgi:hypothetical protein